MLIDKVWNCAKWEFVGNQKTGKTAEKPVRFKGREPYGFQAQKPYGFRPCIFWPVPVLICLNPSPLRVVI